MNKTIINISGMHCKSCEILVEDELTKISGVKKAEVNHKTGIAIIHYENQEIPFNYFKHAVEKAGYKTSNYEDSILTVNKSNNYKELGIAFLLLVILILLLDQLGITKFNIIKNGDYKSLAVVLLVGLTAGFSTCMALVGSIILALSAGFAKEHQNLNFIKKFTPHLFFNSGRIFFFFIFGGLIGLVGSLIQISPAIQGIFIILLSIIMIGLGVNLLNIFPNFNLSITLPKKLSKFFKITQKASDTYKNSQSFILGGLSFFLPCGFTQAMQLFAISTGSFTKGAVTMAVFAAGTTPGLLTVGTLTSFAKGSFGRIFFKFAGLVVILLSLININGGLNLIGAINPLFTNKTLANNIQADPNVSLENGVQIVRMDQLISGYDPNFITIKNDIPVRWIINSKAPLSCAASIVIPSLNISKLLQQGDNIIEFTPNQKGLLKFTCSMGMYTGTFNVIDNKETLDPNKIKEVKANYQKEESSKPQTGCGCSHKI